MVWYLWDAASAGRAWGTSTLGDARLCTPACHGSTGANGSNSQQAYLPWKDPREQERAVTMGDGSVRPLPSLQSLGFLARQPCCTTAGSGQPLVTGKSSTPWGSLTARSMMAPAETLHGCFGLRRPPPGLCLCCRESKGGHALLAALTAKSRVFLISSHPF